MVAGTLFRQIGWSIGHACAALVVPRLCCGRVSGDPVPIQDGYTSSTSATEDLGVPGPGQTGGGVSGASDGVS